MLRKVSPAARRLVFSIVVLLVLVGALQGRVAAMSNGLPGQATFADLVKQIEDLQRWRESHTGDQIYAMGVESMRAVWQDHEEENVDATHPLTLSVYIPEDAKLIDRAFLRLKLLAFRSYSGTVAAGGSSTETSAAGGDHRHKVFDYMGGVWDEYVAFNTDTAAAHNHGFTVGGFYALGTTDPHDTTEFSASGSHAHEYNYPLITMRALKSATGDDFWNVGIGVPSGYTEDIWTYGASGDHAHDVTIPSHVHDIDHGIYEDTPAANVTVTINGTDRTAALGGGAGFVADQDSLDIMRYLAVGWNTIELRSSQLGRIQATYFVKAYLP